MPVYNREKYVREAVESVLNQTFENFEFLIIDDGSEDQTDNILRSFSDARIRLISHSQNKGIAQRMNEGLALARGECLAIMNSDDIAFPERIEKQVAYLDQNPDIGAVASTAILIDAEGRTLSRVWEAEKNSISYKEITKTMKRVCCICNPTTMVRTKILKRYRFNEKLPNFGEDYEMWLHFCSDKNLIYKFSEPLLKYREHSKSERSLHKRGCIKRAQQLRIKTKTLFLLRRLGKFGWNNYATAIFLELQKDVFVWIKYCLQDAFSRIAGSFQFSKTDEKSPRKKRLKKL